MRKLSVHQIVLLMCMTLIAAPSAHADLFGLWVKPKVDFVGGTGEIFKKFEGSPAGGLEVGLELLGLSIWADVEFMDSEQYWASGNVGYDFSFGEDLELTFGVYAGAVFFNFPKDEGGSSGLSDEQKAQIGTIIGADYVDAFEQKYTETFGNEDQIANTAFGLNGRARLSLEYHFLPLLSVGVQGSAGYHFILTGEEAASSSKSLAVDSFIESQPLPDDVDTSVAKRELKKAIGAEEVDIDDLKGINYSAGIFLNFSF